MKVKELKTEGHLLLVMLFAAIVAFSIGGLSLEYVLEMWIPYIKSTPPIDVSFIWCGVLGLFIGIPVLPIAVITFILFNFIL